MEVISTSKNKIANIWMAKALMSPNMSGELLRFKCTSHKKYLKWYYNENRIFPIEDILKHKQVLV